MKELFFKKEADVLGGAAGAVTAALSFAMSASAGHKAIAKKTLGRTSLQSERAFCQSGSENHLHSPSNMTR